MRNGFVNSQTIKENKDFRRLYYRGKSKASPVLVTYAMRRNGGGCRTGITTSKKIGNAVARNRSRRVIRAAYRELSHSISGSWDIVFVARTGTSRVKMQDVHRAMSDHLMSLGVINELDKKAD